MTERLSARFLDSALQAAHEAADAAEAVIKRYYRRSLEIEYKADQSPVTVADREAEVAIRRVLQTHFPAHGVFGEELGSAESDGSEFLWLVDPIDGTKSFIRNYPFFSTQVALRYQGELVLGLSSAAIFGERAWAVRGGGAYLNHERVQISETHELKQAIVSFGNIKTLAADARAWSKMAGLVAQAQRTRGYGDFYHYHLLARGSIDAVIESDVNILDIAALSVIVREAGGIFSELSGNDLNLDTGSVLAATAALHPLLKDYFGC